MLFLIHIYQTNESYFFSSNRFRNIMIHFLLGMIRLFAKFFFVNRFFDTWYNPFNNLFTLYNCTIIIKITLYWL